MEGRGGDGMAKVPNFCALLLCIRLSENLAFFWRGGKGIYHLHDFSKLF